MNTAEPEMMVCCFFVRIGSETLPALDSSLCRIISFAIRQHDRSVNIEEEMKMQQRWTRTQIKLFEKQLRADEKSEATIRKYVHDAGHFLNYVGDGCAVQKELVIAYKQYLTEQYQTTSANSMLAAVNCFLRTAGYPDCVVKALRIQREAFRKRSRELSREEYQRLLDTAKRKGMRRLFLLMQTIAATGIRVSELPFITVESLRYRRAGVSLKGKNRMVLLPEKLCRDLAAYAEERGLRSGSIFVTRSGRPLDRSNILREMKSLGKIAGVDREKIFPHNLRHLFAVTYYKVERDICHLADLLGHSSINTTRIYTLVSSEEQERQIDRLGLLA